MSNLFVSTNVVKFVLSLLKHADAVLTKEVGLTYSQFKVLLTLHEHKSLSQQALAEHHCTTPAAISRLVETLVRKNYIARVSNPVNRRENVLSLTTQGSKQLSTAITLVQQLEKKLYSSIPAKKLSEFLETTQQLLTVISSRT